MKSNINKDYITKNIEKLYSITLLGVQVTHKYTFQSFENKFRNGW